MPIDDLKADVAALMPQARADLERLVRIPSCAFPGFPSAPVREAADAVVAMLRDAGVADARLLDIPDGYPAVYGEIAGRDGAPTVLLYAHYDIQPAGKESAWTSPPYEPVERDGRLYARGAADDKSGVIMHVAALRALGDTLGVTVRVIIEGEEETDSHLGSYVVAHPDLFRADVVISADAGNVRVGKPTLTTALRGVTSCAVEVRTLKGPVHSGQFGGPAPDALIALSRMIASLHDDRGNVALAGLQSGAWTGGGELSENGFRRGAGVVDGAELIGDGSIADRLWSKPSVNVIGIDAPPFEGAANALVPVARARVSLRVAPGEDVRKARDLMIEHLRKAAPWGVQVTITAGGAGPGFAAKTDGPAYAAAKRALDAVFGVETIMGGAGGTIPLMNVFQHVSPDAEIITWGAEDGAAAIHAPDESVDLGELERMILAEAVLLEDLAASHKR
ncbi:MAG TPA: dipeptidase [Dehalococcoidia bacterium]|nr:dipeptidase [Dehalococcoidia bacterium]